jgi:DNA polymerase III sliding clamp (beta) subunit (PCNA family)
VACFFVATPPTSVNGGALAAVLDKMSGDVSLVRETESLRISADGLSVSLEFMTDHADLLEMRDANATASVNADLLFSVTEGMSKFAATKDAVNALMCIYWNPATGELATSDTHTIACCRMSLDTECKEHPGVLLRPDFFKDASKFMSGQITATFGSNIVRFDSPDMMMQYSIMDGRFPRYNEIMDKLEVPNSVDMNATELREALAFIQAARHQDDIPQAVRFVTDGKNLLLREQTTSRDEKKSAKTSITIDGHDGAEMRIDLRGEYVKRCIMGDGSVCIEYRDANTPVRIKNNSGADTDCITCVVSPIYPKN